MTADQRKEWATSDPGSLLQYDAATRKITLGDIETHAYDGEAIRAAQDLGFPGVRDAGPACPRARGVCCVC